MGQMSKPELFKEAVDDSRIQQLSASGIPHSEDPPPVEHSGTERPGLLFWEDGAYLLRDNTGRTSLVEISDVGTPVEIKGPWKVTFPPNLGAPAEITLPRLLSLHRHAEPGVRYFSGTATYSAQFSLALKSVSKRQFLDLGWVEVIAEVKLNGKEIGSVWNPPYRLDITDAVRSGLNDLEIRVTNQWTNRLIGDEQLPPEYEYGGGGFFNYNGPGMDAIQKLPDWYIQGKPKPAGKRVAFCVWRHYRKDDPLLESGLIGPVRVLAAVPKENALEVESA